MTKQYPEISVVIPIRNSGKLIRKCLNSLKRLNYPKNKLEIIIADGCSTDDTQKVAKSLGAKVILNKKKIVVAGRNAGFRAATGELIAFSDDDCIFDKNWLKNSVKHFNDKKVGGVSGPNIVPVTDKPFSRAVGLIFDMAYFVGAGSPTKKFGKVIESRSHGSNAIYRSSVLKKVFPIDETMVEGEDVLMTEKIEALGYKLLYVPDVIVTHFRRSTPDRWWNQMMRYAQAKVLLQKRHIKKVTFIQKLFGLFLPIIFCGLIVAFLIPPLFTLFMALALITFLSLFFYAFSQSRSLVVSLSFFEAFIIMSIAWSWGYLKEFLWGSNKKMIHK